jgi:transposase
MNERLDATQLQQLDKDSLIALILVMQQRIVQLEAMVAQQAARIQALEDQLAKTSGNSSKPPSSDGLKKKPSSLREKGQRPTGGQPGHPGKTLKFSLTPDAIAVHEVSHCPACGTNVETIPALQVEKRQVWDIPPLSLQVTEHQAAVKCCPQCQGRVQADFPVGVTQPVQYGPHLTAQAAYLTTYQLLPLARVCELFSDWYGHAPSEAFLLSAAQRVQTQVTGVVEQIRTQITQAGTVHTDETGLRVEGRLNWAHVVSTERLTVYNIHAKRGAAAWNDIGLLPAVRGWVIHDGFQSYWQLKQCQHGLCNAHHLRELRFLAEQHQQTWAADMARLLVTAHREVQSWCKTGLNLPPERVADYHQQYDRLLQRGYVTQPSAPPARRTRGRPAQSPAKNMLDHLQKFQAQTLAFLSDFRVPFDNNQAERDLRMLKVKQKIAGTFRSRAGAETFCVLRSYISTARKQGQRVLSALYEALLGRPFLPA